MLRLCRGPERELPSASSVAELVSIQATRAPSNHAVRHGGVTLRYVELDTRANALAALLRERGVRPGHSVALCTQRGVDMVVGMLAVLRCGAAYVPIDPTLPNTRVHAIVDESRPYIVLATRATRVMPSFASSEVVVVDQPYRTSAELVMDAGELAYVIFTSGSTGAPKGVAVGSRALINHALSMAELYQLTPSDRVLCSASIGFDIAAEQIFPALLSGAEVVIRPENLFDSLTTFDAFVRSACLTTLILPTAFFREWAAGMERGDLQLPPSLRTVGIGTEQVRARELSAFVARAAGAVRVIHGYGPTEATITCTAYVYDGRPLAPDEAVPIGQPLPNTEAYVVSARGDLADDHEVGELYVGGVALARGYVGRPELTSERFVPHLFANETRLYRTGDLVRRAPDGQLFFVGRQDHQIKVRGHRVEPREIELVLLEQQDITDALVLVREDERQIPQLIAYVVAARPQLAADLARACRQRLPAYMVPSAFVSLSAFPLTLNQKVDRAALPAPGERVGERVTARNDLELLVVHAFQEALERASVCVHDDFFLLGGDSLRALRMLQVIRRSASRELALADVFSAPTPAQLASRLQHGGGLDTPSVLCLKQGQGTPLFLVCGIQLYQALADALDSPNPVFALLLPQEAAYVAGSFALPEVERLAADYTRVLRTHWPDGPYALGGMSFGGAVAYEMAQQLTSMGQHVSLVALFDTVLPRVRARFSRRRLQKRVSSMGVRTFLQAATRQLLRRWRVRATQADSAAELDLQRERAYGLRFAAYDRTIKPYAGKVVLLRAQASEEGARVPHYGFAPLVKRLRVHEIAGDHLGILRQPEVQQLAARLAQELNESR